MRLVRGLLAVVLALLIVGALAWSLRGVRSSDEEPARPRRPPPLLENQATAADVRATHDRFGIRFLLPTRVRGTYWTSSWDGPRRSFDGVDPEDAWFDSDHGTASYRVRNGKLFISGQTPRMYVHDPRSVRQWRDVEITMYFKRVRDQGVPYAGMTAVARSNHLDTASGTRVCDTRGIGARMRYDGHADFEKETAFPLNQATRNVELWPGGMPHNRWIGYKFLVFDRPDGVHLELWRDLTDGRDGGHWHRIGAMVDNGRVLGSVPCAPGIDPQLALTRSPHRPGSETGLPNLTVYFRSDGVGNDGMVYKRGSIREIRRR